MVAKRIKDPRGYFLLRDGVTQSMLADFIDCRQRMKYILDLWESGQSKMALEFGSLWHYLLEQNYRAIREYGSKAPLPFMDVVKLYLDDIGGIPLAPEDWEQAEAMAEALYIPYWEYWIADFKRKWIGVESKFDVKLFKRYRFRGMRDGLFQGRSRSRWLLETKTTAWINESALDDVLNFDFQNLSYVTATEEETKKNVAGVLYNVIQKPGIKLGTKSNPDIPSWFKAIKADIQKSPEKYFRRFEVKYSDIQKKAFRNELLDKLAEFEVWLKGDLPTYKNQSACEKKKFTCEFVRACSSGGQMSEYQKTRELMRELGGL